MGSGQLVFSGHTMKSFLVAASIASVALTAPYNPYSPFLLNPYPSLYYNPYNPNGLSSIVSVGGYKAVAGDNGDLKGAVHEVPGHYSNAAIAPLASNAQLQKSSNVPQTATFNAFNSPVHLNEIVPKGKSGNYNGKQQDKIAVLPSAKSALAYMKSYFGDGDLCSESGAAYMKSILSGASGAEVNSAAESAYKAAWDKGARLSPGSACTASETAFKEAYSSGKDSILESARAFVNNWPGLKAGNPCAVSGKAYMDAIIDGKSVDDAGYLSGKAFISAFGDLANSGNSIEDPACADAAKAYLESSNTPDSASAESAKAFIDATLTSSASGYDPVCAAAAIAYMDAFASGKDALTSNLVAAKAFFKEYSKGSSPAGANSPCVKATLGYSANSPTTSKANKDAMLAFINQAVNDGPELFTDPVCGAATLAYLDAKIAGKSDKQAGADSAEAYLEAFAANDGKRTEACKRAAEAYIKTF